MEKNEDEMKQVGTTNGETMAEDFGAQGTETGKSETEKLGVQETEEIDKKETTDQDKRKGNGGGKVRMALGIAIMLVGIGVCLYPFYRQKKSDDFNQDAINMILTPQPTKVQEQTPDREEAPTMPPEMTQAAQVVSDVSDVSTAPEDKEDGDGQVTVLGGDLLENMDAPDVEDEEEKENANRLNNQTVVGVIQIPKIDLIYAIVEGSDSAEIGVAIGHMSNTAKLGEIGNCALAGHRGGYSGPYFKNLDKLEIGDEVIITDTKHQVFTYKVTEMMVVQPDEVWVIEDTGEGVAMLTLVTCENSGTERLIVRCVVP